MMRQTTMSLRTRLVIGGMVALIGSVLVRGVADPMHAAILDAHDLNGDGVPDFVFAEPEADDATGVVTIEDGTDAEVDLCTLLGPAPGALFGTSVVIARVDDDGALDLVVAAPADAGGHVYFFLGPFGDRPVLTVDDADGMFPAPASDLISFGDAIAVLPDVDGDCFAELLVRGFRPDDGNAQSERAWLLSGSTGAVLLVVHPTDDFDPWRFIGPTKND